MIYCTELLAKEAHSPVGVNRLVASGRLGGVSNGSPGIARNVTLNPALGKIFSIFFTSLPVSCCIICQIACMDLATVLLHSV